MSLVTASIEIAAPPEEVWEVVMDPHRFDEWVTIHRRLDHADDGAPRTGMRVDQTLVLRHAPVKVHWTLVECDPPRRATWEGHGPAHSQARTAYVLTPNGAGGTRFDYENEFHPPGGRLGLAASRLLVGGVAQREATHSLQRLKALVEA